MRFPTYQDLSAEQDEINNLPLRGSYLISGPPGTGKTVMALYRAQMIASRGRTVRLLMHGKLLSQYTAGVVEGLGVDGVVTTFHSWLWAWCRSNWGMSTPQLARYVPDWSKILDLALERPPKKDAMSALLVDEGQDLPPLFYLFARTIADGVTVYADENQRITDQNSTLDEIRQRVRPDSEHRLTRNYRNTREIARVARHFYTDVETGMPDVPDRSGPMPTLTAHPRLHESAQQIATYARNFRRQQIGVLVPNSKLLKKYVSRLAAALPDDTRLQYYLAKEEGLEIDFDEPGVTVANWGSAKGLEFDAVFLPELQDIRRELDDPTLTMELYVLCSRARERLFLSYSGDGSPAILSILPMDDLDTPHE